MTNPALLSLAKVVLPSELVENFDITEIESDTREIHIHMDEVIPVEYKGNSDYESKGFISPVSITDFPIRDHKVILLLRRRKWQDRRTGKSFLHPLKVAAEGTRYSKEFASFLKGTYGQIPRDLPYT